MEEKTLNLYEKIVKIYFLKKEFTDFSSNMSNTLNLSIAAKPEIIETIKNSFINSLDPNIGISIASYMSKNPNFFDFKSLKESIGINYVLSVTGEGRNAYLYEQRVGDNDSYCNCNVFFEQERHNNIFDYLLFFRKAFLLSALVFENGTQYEKQNWEILLQNNSYNILGFILSKGKELGRELYNNMNNYISGTFSVKKIFNKTRNYYEYNVLAQGIEKIRELKVEKIVSNNKKVKCIYRMFDFGCYGDIIYRANFDRENSFSKNFFPLYIKINSNGDVISENIDFGRLTSPNLTIKNRKLANEIIMKTLTQSISERINDTIDKIYLDLAATYSEEENGKNLLSSKLDLVYSSIYNINKRFNEIMINTNFMK